ncbi:MAG: VPLPA-CTERM sorting domain-containing protein [bacterium]
MNSNKTILSTAIAIALGSASFTASAFLTTSATLNFTLGQVQDVGGGQTDIIGSYFAVDFNSNGDIEAAEKTPIGSFNGIHIGVAQPAFGSHSGAINGSEIPDIDNPWEWLGVTGMHQTVSPITDLTGSGATRTLDFSGWSWDWNGLDVPFVDLGTTITCDTASCSDSSNYTIDGAFHFDGAGFTTASYALHLEGTISSVPVPAAAWLFGSGLACLAGVARRRKKVT